jgi:hypothetical protein
MQHNLSQNTNPTAQEYIGSQIDSSAEGHAQDRLFTIAQKADQ